eukprot:1156994-Pelagomonas_calceolata.AAC.4
MELPPCMFQRFLQLRCLHRSFACTGAQVQTKERLFTPLLVHGRPKFHHMAYEQGCQGCTF